MTTLSIGPALAFYLRHAAECDQLREIRKLESDGPELAADDWRKFEDVMERASLQVERVLDAARDDALDALAGVAKVTARGRKTRQDWFSWAEIESKRSGALTIGVSLVRNGTTVEVLPYVYLEAAKIRAKGGRPDVQAAREELAARLRGGGLEQAVVAGDDIVLAAIALDERADLGDVLGRSMSTFERLRDRWDTVFS